MPKQTEQNKARILIIVGLLFSFGIALTFNQVPLIRNKSDFFQRWYATTKLLSENRNLYDAQNGEEVLAFVYGDNPVYETTNFYYPAHLLLFIAPLALLPYPTAHLIWTTGIQLFYLAALWLMSNHLHWPGTVNKTTLLLALASLFLPSLQHTIWGQFNTIGVLSLVLSYLALQQGKDGWAGIWLVGLTFKPQATLLPLLFLLLWALWQRRWRFLTGFTVLSLAMWLFAELFQPGWVFDFINSLGGYIPVQSVVDQIWNPFQLVTIGLLLAVMLLYIKNRNVPASSPTFAALLIFTVAVWTLIVPIVGMMHNVILLPMLILLFANLRTNGPTWYKPALVSFIIIYVAGWIGFVWGLSDPALYGKHIEWSELAYKTIMPGLMLLFSLKLFLPEQHRLEAL